MLTRIEYSSHQKKCRCSRQEAHILLYSSKEARFLYEVKFLMYKVIFDVVLKLSMSKRAGEIRTVDNPEKFQSHALRALSMSNAALKVKLTVNCSNK